jgi:hypothetical protein
MPTKSTKNYKDNLRNYLRFVNEVSKEFKNSELMKRRFYEKFQIFYLTRQKIN